MTRIPPAISGSESVSGSLSCPPGPRREAPSAPLAPNANSAGTREPAVTQPPQRGGKRAGAGRKPAGRKPYLVRMKPATMAALRAKARRLGLKPPGAVLDQDDAP